MTNSEDPIRPPSLLVLPSYVAASLGRIGSHGFSDALAEHGLSLPHNAILTALADFGPLAQHELADRLDIQRSHLVGYLDGLEDRGLAQRTRDAEDRRRQIVTLTKTGRALQRRLQRTAERSQARFLATLSDEEQQTLVTLLNRVLRAHDEARLREPPPPARARRS